MTSISPKLLWLCLFLSVCTMMTTACGEDDATESAAVEFPAYLLVANPQSPNPADEVLVSVATLDMTGWVSIHTDADGAPGEALGHTQLERGKNNNTIVKLSRAAQNGESLIAMLHEDSGAEGTFEYPGADSVLKDAEKNETITVFTVEAFDITEPSIKVTANQEPDSDELNELRIREVVSIESGWVAIREDNAGEPGAVIGEAFIPPGISRDFSVKLSRNVNDGELFHAVLHIEAGAIGVFEFPGVDEEAQTSSGGRVSALIGVGVDPPVFEPTVSVSDQTPSPLNEVVIGGVNHEQQGWVVVFDSSDTDLGHTAVSSGGSSDVRVTLSRDVVDGETLTAALYNDAGEVGAYEVPDPDGAASGESGDAVRSSFTVTLEAAVPSVTQGDQTLSNLSSLVNVSEVVSNGPGWIVIHLDDAGSPGQAIGQTQVNNGTNSNLTVQVDRALGDTTLHAMLHTDAGEVGVYDGATDVPVDGAIVAFNITVPAETPDARLTLSNDGQAYTLEGTEGMSSGVVGAGNNPDMTFQAGMRYEFINNARPNNHPISFLTLGADSASDVVLLSQTADGSLEADPDVLWTDDGNLTLAFTVAGGLLTDLTGYRCEIHVDAMRAGVSVTP